MPPIQYRQPTVHPQYQSGNQQNQPTNNGLSKLVIILCVTIVAVIFLLILILLLVFLVGSNNTHLRMVNKITDLYPDDHAMGDLLLFDGTDDYDFVGIINGETMNLNNVTTIPF